MVRFATDIKMLVNGANIGFVLNNRYFLGNSDTTLHVLCLLSLMISYHLDGTRSSQLLLLEVFCLYKALGAAFPRPFLAGDDIWLFFTCLSH